LAKEIEKRKPPKLLLRFLVGIPAGALAVYLLAFGDWTLAVVTALAGWFALREFWRIAGVENPGVKFPLARLGEIAAIIFLMASWMFPNGSFSVMLAIMIPCFFIYQLILKAHGAKEFLREVAVVTLGVVYIGGFMSFIFKLRHLEEYLESSGVINLTNGWFSNPGMSHLVQFAILTSWGCDTAAYFSGKYFGKTKLAPGISPGKTVIGLVGGMVGAATVVLLYSWLTGLINQVQVYELIAFGAFAAAFSQLGDLTISAIKREANAKESGRILGAHGGLLDRLDGFLFALPATYIFFLLVLG